MVVITKITTQKKNQERYNVFVDRGNGEEFGFSVDQDVLIKYRLKKGLELDEAELQGILFQDEIKKGFHLALHFLSYRMRSLKEIRQYLHKKDMTELAVKEIIKKLMEYGYVNDLEFANAFVRSRKNTTTKGPEVIRQELLEKGVESSILEKSLEQYTYDEQLDAVIAFLNKQSTRDHKRSKIALKQKLSNSLYRKGFTWSVIEKAFEQVNVTNDDNEESKALEYEGNKAVNKYKKYSGWDFERRVRQYLYGKGFSFEMIDIFLSRLKKEENENEH